MSFNFESSIRSLSFRIFCCLNKCSVCALYFSPQTTRNAAFCLRKIELIFEFKGGTPNFGSVYEVTVDYDYEVFRTSKFCFQNGACRVSTK
jgi:hypothetical protein